MKIRLRSKSPDSGSSGAEEVVETTSPNGNGHGLSQRQFLKTLAAAAAVGVAGQFAVARRAEATYIPGTGGDTVDRDLTVQGNLIVQPSGTGFGPGRVIISRPISAVAQSHIFLYEGANERARIGVDGNDQLCLMAGATDVPALSVAPSGSIGIGIATPAGKLDVAGEIRVSGVVAIDTTATAKQTYYAP